MIGNYPFPERYDWAINRPFLCVVYVYNRLSGVFVIRRVWLLCCLVVGILDLFSFVWVEKLVLA